MTCMSSFKGIKRKLKLIKKQMIEKNKDISTAPKLEVLYLLREG